SSGLWPSKAGQTLVDAAARMEALANEAARHQRAADLELTGPLCLSVPNPILQYLLFDSIIEFTERYPSVELTIDASDELADLDRAEADIVVRSSDTPPEHWVGRRLFPYMLSLYAQREYLSRTSESDFRWIAPLEQTARWPDWLADSPYPNAPIALRISGIAGRFQALRRGYGIGRAACFMADSEPGLVRLPDAPLVAAETLWVLSHPDLAKIERARVAIRFFADALKAKQGLIQGTP
ncbi:MAG: LysR family transcriptional regulator, partial [Pseudomonadota bacterium]